ncbi:hypothetical protein DPMN_111116 [Dreissena polymorpha]|uniref:Uncharacterized protein n=4 Tax=Dreissena polymorpha TaxID=45954 RepID=A0A9D4KDV1_DREPO|nr:hypothetical protein DPMN_111114 [Dreissena polymorpha]KAH3837715.1 hypothetical protein DPMN_111116 [Dreissena polymorpha]
MADNNKGDQVAPGENTEDAAASEHVDEEDPVSESPEIEVVPPLKAPPENQ